MLVAALLHISHILIVVDAGVCGRRGHIVIDLVAGVIIFTLHRLALIIVLKHLVLVLELVLNNLEHLVGHLKEDGDHSFLEVKVDDISLVDSLTRLLLFFLALSGGWTSLLLLLALLNVMTALNMFINVNIKLKKLLSNEILNKLVIIHKFLVVDLGSTL